MQSKELQAVVEADAAQHAAQYAALQAALADEAGGAAGGAASPPPSLLCSFEQYMWLAALAVRAPSCGGMAWHCMTHDTSLSPADDALLFVLE